MRQYVLSAVMAVFGQTALADVSVAFLESAPKDTFVITNEGTCPLSEVTIVLDLSASQSGLIFDVTEKGAGVSVFQPLEIVAGRDALEVVPQVLDGDNQIDLRVKSLEAGAQIAFTIDVDDTLGVSATRISGAEIEGARLRVVRDTSNTEAVFSTDATARAVYNSCTA